MPKYLTKAELYRVLQRELPEDVYADGAPDSFFTTADMGSISKNLESAYLNLEQLYLNFFPLSADVEKIADHEVTVFGMVAQSLPLQERRDRVVAKLRERKDLSLWTILTSILTGFSSNVTLEIIDDWVGHEWLLDISKLDAETFLGGIRTALVSSTDGYVPAGTPVQIAVMGVGGWTLDVSRLSVDTILGARRTFLSEVADGFDFCDLPDSTLWNDQKTQAYTYEVRIFGYNLTDAEMSALDAFLTKIEPARATHVIVDNCDLTNYGLIYTHTNVERASLETCVYTDESSLTGFSARSADA